LFAWLRTTWRRTIWRGAIHHGVGIVHVDRDYDRIAEVRPLTVRRLRTVP
jgi:hypothetical protein